MFVENSRFAIYIGVQLGMVGQFLFYFYFCKISLNVVPPLFVTKFFLLHNKICGRYPFHVRALAIRFDFIFKKYSAGQPKRHLLTTGWSVFVSAKRLAAGDSVLFIWWVFHWLLGV